jgi:hypothetical protein
MGPLLIADNHAAEPERGSSVDVPRSSAPKVSATSRARCATLAEHLDPALLQLVTAMNGLQIRPR